MHEIWKKYSKYQQCWLISIKVTHSSDFSQFHFLLENMVGNKHPTNCLSMILSSFHFKTFINHVTAGLLQQRHSFKIKCVALKRAVLQSHKRRLLSLLCLFGQENCLNVGQYTTLGDGHSRQQLVQFLVISDGELQMSRDDSGFLVVSGCIACQFQHFGGQVFQDGCKVNWCTSSNSFCIVALSEQSVDTSYWELKSSTAGSALCLPLRFSSFTSARHCDKFSEMWWRKNADLDIYRQNRIDLLFLTLKYFNQWKPSSQWKLRQNAGRLANPIAASIGS